MVEKTIFPHFQHDPTKLLHIEQKIWHPKAKSH